MSLPSESQNKVRFGAFEIDLRTAELRTNGQELTLQGQPFQILMVLLERPGELVTRDELKKILWTSETFVDFEHGLNKAVNRLREALDDSAEHPKFVETLPRRGYRWIGPVIRNGNDIVARESRLVVPGAEHSSEMLTLSVESRAGRSSRFWLAIPAGCLIIALAAGFLFLHSRHAPPLTEKDSIVLADFTNTTGDSVFDDTLKQGLSAQLSQSPFLNLLPDQMVRETLKLMGRGPGDRLSPEVAREICIRSSSKAMLAGSISSLGTQYVIGLKAVNCNSGEVLAQEQVQAAAKEEVLKVLSHEATTMRQKLGESLSSIRRFDVPLYQVTTPSLEALKAYSTADIARAQRGDRAAIPFLRRAIELDPNFAMAHAFLATLYVNLQETSLSTESMKRAYDLRDRVSEKERFYIESHYYHFVTGDLEKANQVYEQFAQTYPSSEGHLVNLAGSYGSMGQYDKAVAASLEALRLDPENYVAYANLVAIYTNLNRLDDARATYQKMLENKRDYPDAHVSLYGIAAAEGDVAEMRRQAAWANGKVGIEDILLVQEADTEAFHGRLSEAREFSRRAIESAERAGKKEAAVLWQMNVALREAEFGNWQVARHGAATALAVAATRELQTLAILILAQSGDAEQAETMSDDLARRYPHDTLINGYWLPTIRAAIELDRNNPAEAIHLLQGAASYELGAVLFTGDWAAPLHPAYVRGEAYLRLHRGEEAAVEYQKFVDHWGAVRNSPLGALARLGLARAYAMQGDHAKAHIAYQDFFDLWKDADPDIPILKEAKAEYAKLQ
jgi:DNA-binding winged helix-turn-helix (wHTH) protein/tetratricopeptide (TPR) repeat protein